MKGRIVVYTRNLKKEAIQVCSSWAHHGLHDQGRQDVNEVVIIIFTEDMQCSGLKRQASRGRHRATATGLRRGARQRQLQAAAGQ